jgi:hypothetical protein
MRTVLKIAGEIAMTGLDSEVEEEQRKQDKFIAFRRFILNLCFHKRDTPAENVELLEEVVPLFQAMKLFYIKPEEKSQRKKVKKSTEAVEQPNESQFHKVLIDLMISILTKAESISQFFWWHNVIGFVRDSIKELFDAVSEDCGPEALDILIAVISRPELVNG